MKKGLTKTLRMAGNDFDQHGSSLTEDEHTVNSIFNQHSSSRRRIDTLIHCKQQATTWISVAQDRRRIDRLTHCKWQTTTSISMARFEGGSTDSLTANGREQLFWCIVSSKDGRSQPKSWTKHSVMKSIKYASS
jgi:hypothetical protein